MGTHFTREVESRMQPTDDDLGLRLLGEVQALRNEILMLGNREQARAVKAKLVALHEASRGETVAADVAHIVDEFLTLSKASIVKSYGTAAWDEPETVQEAKARMGKLPAAPGSQYTVDLQRESEASLAKAASELGSISTPAATASDGPHSLPDEVLDELARTEQSAPDGSASYDVVEVRCLVAEVRRLRSDFEEIRRAAQRLITACPRPDDEEGRRIRDEAIAVLAGRAKI